MTKRPLPFTDEQIDKALGKPTDDDYEKAEDIIQGYLKMGYHYRSPVKGDAEILFEQTCDHCGTWALNAAALEPEDGSEYVLVSECMNCGKGELV